MPIRCFKDQELTVRFLDGNKILWDVKVKSWYVLAQSWWIMSQASWYEMKTWYTFDWWYKYDLWAEQPFKLYDFYSPVTSKFDLFGFWTENAINWWCNWSWWGWGGSSSTPKTTINNEEVKDYEFDTPQYNWNYSDEMNQAYQFAYRNWITTMNSIEKADMDGPLTRIAMAKMLSQYAINVLWLKENQTKNNKFNDVIDELDADYDNWVTLAYQLGIMWINMPNNEFRPFDYVTRAEFGTALSRMLYWIADGKELYYRPHLDKLLAEKIITNDNPELQELRWYVMLMLMRSAM